MSVLFAAAATLAVYAVAYVPLERMFPARRQPVFRREWLLDLAFFAGQQMVFAGLTIAFLIHGEGVIHRALPLGWSVAIAAQPWWLRAFEVVILGDLSVYWTHRAFHHFDFLWRFHRVHHTSETLDWLAGYREHPVDGICTALAQNLPAFMLGFPVATLAPLIVFRGMWSLLIHSNTRLPLGPLRWMVGAPEWHHWHHAKVERTAHNFANLAPWTDVLFGTHHQPASEDYALGVTEEVPSSYLGHLVSPFRPAAADSNAAENVSAIAPLIS